MWVCRLSHVSQGLCLCVANVIRVQSARETGSGICTSPTPDGARRRSVLPGSASSWGDPIFDASRALSGKGSTHRTHMQVHAHPARTRRRAGRRRQRPSAMRNAIACAPGHKHNPHAHPHPPSSFLRSYLLPRTSLRSSRVAANQKKFKRKLWKQADIIIKRMTNYSRNARPCHAERAKRDSRDHARAPPPGP